MLESLSTWKKTFDTIAHHILLQKREHYGIRRVANGRFSSYLKNRAQFVSIGNISSTIKELLTGALQGSVLGPLLFLLYINDLYNSVKYAKTYHFADGTSVILSSTSLEILSKQCVKILQTANYMINDLFRIFNYNKKRFDSLKKECPANFLPFYRDF